MGRIKTIPMKRATNQLLKEYPTAFKTDFTENKEIVSKYLVTKSKKIRNTVAGYITRIVRKTTT